MAVSREDVLHVARLARLRLSPEEVERFTTQLSGILAHVRELESVDVDRVEAFGGAAEGAAPLRSEDAAPDALDFPLSVLAPAWRDGFFVVPRLPAMDVEELEDPFEDKARVEPASSPASPEREGAEP
ncbi:MAG TPA: Asp-tRNA(Asn)/Glu-tRNA(Gln) amidotransferase subunit GatC [Longimicrobiales bacterium]